MGARDLLADLAEAGLTVAADGDRLVIRPASKLTDDMRAALRQFKPAVLSLLAAGACPQTGDELAPIAVAPFAPPDLVAWTDDDIARFAARRVRLIRWGWPEGDAEALAERLVMRDLSGDDRASCFECGHHRPGRCGNHRAAGLHTPELGHQLAGALQRCPGHQMTR